MYLDLHCGDYDIIHVFDLHDGLICWDVDCFCTNTPNTVMLLLFPHINNVPIIFTFFKTRSTHLEGRSFI